MRTLLDSLPKIKTVKLDVAGCSHEVSVNSSEEVPELQVNKSHPISLNCFSTTGKNRTSSTRIQIHSRSISRAIRSVPRQSSVGSCFCAYICRKDSCCRICDFSGTAGQTASYLYDSYQGKMYIFYNF
jgi:hypothetical protein